jgi:predicted RNA methylase
MARRQSKDPLEFYETPASAVRQIAKHLPAWSTVLDPCAGNGAILKTIASLRPSVFPDRKAKLVGIEIDVDRFNQCRKECPNALAYNGDAFAEGYATLWENADLVIFNAGFSQAQRFIEYALEHQTEGATIAALVRLAFLETPGRAKLLRAHPPDVFVFPKRPSFTGDGKSDRAAYCWLLWGPRRGGRWYLLGEDDE